jgi:hypothetical protein
VCRVGRAYVTGPHAHAAAQRAFEMCVTRRLSDRHMHTHRGTTHAVGQEVVLLLAAGHVYSFRCVHAHSGISNHNLSREGR